MAEPTFFADAAGFSRWLERHASTFSELAVGFHKVDSGRPKLSWPESVDEALCVGWIDGVRRRIDAHSYQIRFTPRRSTSICSAVNIAKFHRLQAEGRMRAAGVAAFARRTEPKSLVYAYEQREVPSLSTAEMRAFRKHATAWTFFEATPDGYRKVVLHWIASAKKPATRVARLAKLVEACADGRRLR